MDFQNGVGEEAVEDEVERKAPPRRTNATLAIEELRLELLNNFGSNTIQKTEITVRQRRLLAMLMNMGHNMFPISSKVGIKGGEFTVVTSEFLIKYMSLWIELGIPVGRKGREEELRALMAILGEPYTDIESSNISKNKLLG